MKQLIAVAVLAALLAGCASVYTGTITVTSVVDTSMKAWADLSVHGKTTPATDAKVTAAHDKYRQLCGVAACGLTAYKESGDPAQYQAAVASAFAAAGELVDLIVPLLSPSQATDIRTKLGKAKTL